MYINIKIYVAFSKFTIFRTLFSLNFHILITMHIYIPLFAYFHFSVGLFNHSITCLPTSVITILICIHQ